MTTSFTDWGSEMCLEHHGIKGQKWGVRRYQNPDGTLTEAGKKRVAKAGSYLNPNRKQRRVNTLERGEVSGKYNKEWNSNHDAMYEKPHVPIRERQGMLLKLF